MMNHFPNETSYRVWKMLEFDAKNNIKSPLGLVALLVACDPAVTLEQTQNDQLEM